MDMTPLIEFKKVTKRFDTRTVLDGVDLTIEQGQVTTIIGKSGVGKSVLLKHIIGLLEPDQGQILLHGRPIHRVNGKEKESRLGRISYMFQNNALFDALTVYENIALPLRYTTRLDKKQIHAKVMDRIEQTELTEAARRYPAELSGGMQKRAALARALVIDPEIVLFDEPTTGQDPIRRNAILSMIAAYQRRLGFTAVLISHDLPDVFFISNRIIALYEGKVIFQGSPEGFDDFDHPFRYEFVQSLEALQQELTSLYTRRQFKVRYQTELHANPQFDTYAVVVFTLENLDEIQNKLGHTAAQELIRAIGTFISKHFGEVGGFSTRYGFNQYATVLPYSDSREAQSLAKSFAEDFKINGIAEMRKFVQAEITCQDAVFISMLAGVAQGKPDMDIESIVKVAGSKQAKILEFSAKCKGKQT
jgi:phospholipid/cholesterol/gamma-HCH transport system ATP-binding protein